MDMKEVDQNEWAFIRDGDDDEELVTYGVGPCIAVAIINRTKAWAGLFHYDNVHHKTSELEDFLAEAADACDSDDDVEVSYGGGDASDPITSQGVGQARAAVEAAVRGVFPSANLPMWLDDGGAYNVTLTKDPLVILFEFEPAG